MNIVWNGTGKNITKYNKLISEANKRGYIIELNGIRYLVGQQKKVIGHLNFII